MSRHAVWHNRAPLDLRAKSAGREIPFFPGDFGVWIRNSLIQWARLFGVKRGLRGTFWVSLGTDTLRFCCRQCRQQIFSVLLDRETEYAAQIDALRAGRRDAADQLLLDAAIASKALQALGRHPALQVTDDKDTITLEFADGSVGTVHYLANGDKGFPKERLEVFCAGRVLQLDNFRRLRGWGWKGFSKMRLLRQDKDQAACASAFVDAVKRGQATPIPLDEIFEVSRVSIELQNALRA